jgi:hypothetical protein
MQHILAMFAELKSQLTKVDIEVLSNSSFLYTPHF